MERSYVNTHYARKYQDGDSEYERIILCKNPFVRGLCKAGKLWEAPAGAVMEEE